MTWRGFLSDAFLVAGVASIAWGCWVVFAPALFWWLGGVAMLYGTMIGNGDDS